MSQNIDGPFTWKEAERVLREGRNPYSRKVYNNTYLTFDGNIISLVLHETPIMTLYPDGDVTVCMGGWNTPTTRKRLNDYLPYGWQIVVRNRIPYINHPWSSISDPVTIPFVEGMTLHPDGNITLPRDPYVEEEKRRQLLADIRAYAKGFAKALPVPPPDTGDCWYCMLRIKDTNVPMGESFKNTDHLISHMEHNYYVPSLLYRALEVRGYGGFYFSAAFGQKGVFDPDDKWYKKTIARAITDYMCQQFGI